MTATRRPSLAAPPVPPGSLTVAPTGPEVLAFLEALGRWVAELARRARRRSTPRPSSRPIPTRYTARHHARDVAAPVDRRSRYDELVVGVRQRPGRTDELAALAALHVGPAARRARRAVGVHPHRGVHARRPRSSTGSRPRCRPTRSAARASRPHRRRAAPRSSGAAARPRSLGIRPAAHRRARRPPRSRGRAVATATRSVPTVDAVDVAVTALERDLIKEAALRASTAHRLAESSSRYERAASAETASVDASWRSGADRGSPTRRGSRCPTRRVLGRPPPAPPARRSDAATLGGRTARELDAYARRLDRCGRALDEAERAYGAPLAAARRAPRAPRRVPRPVPRAAAWPRTPSSTAAYEAAHDLLWSAPCDLDDRGADGSRSTSTRCAVAVGADRPRPTGRDAGGAVVTLAACTQPGCTGQIEDGYCNVCGMPADAAASASASTRDGRARRRRRARASRPSCRARRSARRAPGSAGRRAGWSARPAAIQHLGAGITTVPSAPVPDPQSIVLAEPRGRRGEALLLECGEQVGRSRAGKPGRAEGFCPKCRHAVLVHAEAAARRPRRRAVRGRRLHRARRTRLDLPRAGPQRVRPLRRAEGPAEHRRRRRARGRDHRAAVPRRGAAPADPRDLQLREPRGRRLHRDGVRRRPVAQADPQGAHGAEQRRVRPVPRRPGDRLHRRDPARVLVPALAGAALLRLQARQRHPGRRLAQAHRPRWRAARRRRPVGDLRHRRLPGARGRRRRAERRRATSSRSAARSRCWRWSSAATSRPTSRRCRRSTTRRCSSGTTRCTACWRRRPRPNPDDRFQSADELRDQLLGVLREVVAVDSGRPRPRRTRPRRRCSASPTGTGARADVGRPARCCGSTGPTRSATWLAGVSLADGAAAARGAANRRPSRRSRCSSPRRAPRSTPASFAARRRRC